jgi:hypothetical protein
MSSRRRASWKITHGRKFGKGLEEINGVAPKPTSGAMRLFKDNSDIGN